METSTFSVKEIIGMARVLKPRMAISAVYDEPPARPTDEYAKATMKNTVAMK